MPEFITDLFQTRVEGLYLMVHTLNVKIVLASLMIGRYPDKTMIPNVPFQGHSSLEFFGVELNDERQQFGGFFGSIGNAVNTVGNWMSGQSQEDESLRLRQTEFESSSNTASGQVLGGNLNIGASFQDKGDILNGNTDTLLGTFDQIIQEGAGLENDLETVILSNASGGDVRPATQLGTVSSLNNLRDTFKRQFGKDPAAGLIPSDRKFEESDLLYNISDIEELDSALGTQDNIFSKIKKAISDRDSYVSMLQANIAKTEELNEIEQFLETGDDGTTFSGTEGVMGGFSEFLAKSANALQTASDILTGKVAEGTVYDHLIEDDTRNLLGYGSGKRFILRDEYIISANFTESPPDFTRIDVTGNAPLNMGSSINQGFDGLYFWAGATDFDLWRQYGYKYKQVTLPFVSDPEGQGKPYAILELAMQKMKINKANVTIAGNEFYQPGDTVYLPSKGLLYYVSSVSHSFSFGSSFTTSLSLEYGHPPGFYIPGPLDVIGQQLVSNFLEDPAIIYRSDETDDNYRPLQPDSTLVFPTGSCDPTSLLAFSDNQIRFTNMMIDLMGSVSSSKYVLIRGFATEEGDESVDEAKEKMRVVRYLLENPSQLSQAKPYSGGDDILNFGANVATSVSSMFGGGSVGTTQSLKEMRLPNNLPVVPISPSKIIEQVSYFKKSSSEDVGQIKCLDRELVAAIEHDFEFSDTEVQGIFPKGGPRQGSWLDLRDEISGFNFTSSFKANIVEVGIVSIPTSMLTKTIPIYEEEDVAGATINIGGTDE